MLRYLILKYGLFIYVFVCFTLVVFLKFQQCVETNSELRAVSIAFIHSVYYYPTSQMQGSNALALLLTIDHQNQDLPSTSRKFTLIASDGEKVSRTLVNFHMESMDSCQMTMTVARTNTIGNLRKLELETNGHRVQIPFKIGRYLIDKPVIMCSSPLAAAENWQSFLISAHVANRYGGHLHLYISSVVEAYLQLIRKYEKEGFITADYWPKMTFQERFFVETFEAAVRTDCLLQFRETAKFITFFDLEDVLIPINHSSYLDEFTARFSMESDPETTSHVFYQQTGYQFSRAVPFSNFSFSALKTIRQLSKVRSGHVVIRSITHPSSWVEQRRNDMIIDPKIKYQLLHHRLLSSGANEKSLRNFESFGQIIGGENLEKVEEQFDRMKKVANISSSSLSESPLNSPILHDCHQRFRRQNRQICFDRDTCQLPIDQKCVVFGAEYSNGPFMYPVSFHFAKRILLTRDGEC